MNQGAIVVRDARTVLMVCGAVVNVDGPSTESYDNVKRLTTGTTMCGIKMARGHCGKVVQRT